jgi:TRAP-type C4-dicarboxylate transport system permease small subunit
MAEDRGRPAADAGSRWAGRGMFVLSAFACLVLFVMMSVTFVDVLGRYLFNRPLPGAYELIAFMMPLMIFAILPRVCYREDHVTVDLLDGFAPSSWRRWQASAVSLVGAAVIGVLAWRLFVQAVDNGRNDEVSTEHLWPLSIFGYFMAAMSVLACVSLLVVSVQHWRGARRAAGERSGDPGS